MPMLHSIKKHNAAPLQK